MPPYTVAVIHGGPGVAGEMAPVAREISRTYGVIEPLQTEWTLAGQVVELKNVLTRQGSLPVVLVGHSWGAMLGYIFAAKYPAMVKKTSHLSQPQYTHCSTIFIATSINSMFCLFASLKMGLFVEAVMCISENGNNNADNQESFSGRKFIGYFDDLIIYQDMLDADQPNSSAVDIDNICLTETLI